MADSKKKPKKCLGRFETSYMKAMVAPQPQDYPPCTRDYGQHNKVLNDIEMNKKFQFPMGLPKYKYDFCGEQYPMPGQKKPKPKPGPNYKPSCPQYAPYHSTMQDMHLIQRRLETAPEHEHTWYREKTDSVQMKKLGQIKEQLDSLKQLFAEERNRFHSLEQQLERMKANPKSPRGVDSPALNERLLKTSEADKVLMWLNSFDEGFNNRSTTPRTPRRTWNNQVVSKEKIMQEWLGFQQGDKESIADYSERFWKLRLEMQGMQSLSNEEQLRKFVAGLKFKIRNEVVCVRPASLADAIALAERAEMRFTMKNKGKVKKRMNTRKSGRVSEPRKRPGQVISPAEQFQYLNLHSSCSCRKE